VSKERTNNRGDREREAAIKQAAKAHEQERQERQVSMKGAGDVLGKHGGAAITQPSHHHKPKQPAGRTRPAGAKDAAAKGASTKGGQKKGRPTPKQSAARTPVNKTRPHAPVGRADGPLARRRRFRIRLLVGLLLLVNIVAAVVWRDWAVSLAVLIGSFILAPLLAAILLRRK
jgi:hypothetical protein